jgi:polyphenol oxidase
MWKLAASGISKLPDIAHGFFGRTGGTSSGLYASLNCGPGSGDDRINVTENRRRALAALTPRDCRLVTLYQIHSSDALVVRRPWEIGEAPKADAMATNASGIALGILTADCAPVLLAEVEARVIGAAHAGWKGALAGVIEQAIARMEELGARRERIAAAIGPSISRSAYEVGEDLRAAVLARDGAATQFFVPGTQAGHWQFDLAGYVHNRLRNEGIQNIEVLARCTYAEPENFYSFRRTTHLGESDYGRQLSAIAFL